MPPAQLVTVPTLKRWLRPVLRPFWSNEMGTYANFSDLQYQVPSEALFQAAADSHDVPEGPARDNVELFDCDDYAFSFRAHIARFARMDESVAAPLCCGIGWARFSWIGGGGIDHACNWVWLESTGFRWFEPQTGALHPAEACAGRLNLILL